MRGGQSSSSNQCLQQDLPNIIQQEIRVGAEYVRVTSKFTGYAEVEDSLKKLLNFSVVKEATGDKEVLETEVEAANFLLDLLADRNRRGMLHVVCLDKADFTVQFKLTDKLNHSLKGDTSSQSVGFEAGREGGGGAESKPHWLRPHGALCRNYA